MLEGDGSDAACYNPDLRDLMPFGLDLRSFGDTLLYLTAFFGAFLAALWLSLVFWAYRDIKARSHDRFVHFFAALVVGVLGPPGLVVYLILRPTKTLDEAYQHTLEEEALLTEIEERTVCPACGSRTEAGEALARPV